MATEFTPWMSLAGGALIGVAAVIMMAANGRIAGISGIVSRLLGPQADKATMPQGLAFVVGLLLAAPLWHLLVGTIDNQVTTSHALMAVGGLLVGFGSVLGSGCTSGHGVCGISRLSMRSVVATIVFMLSAIATVAIVRHGIAG